MKILIYSPLFFPSIGGTETIAGIFADEFISAGHKVRLVTYTPTEMPDTFKFEVIRNPSKLKLLKLVKWCHLCFHITISLKGLWPLFFFKRTLAISHQTWTPQKSIIGKMKHWVFKRAINIANSQVIASHIKAKTYIVHNAYQDTIFRKIPEINRTKEIAFLGRLVSDKGCEILLRAMAILKEKGIVFSSTIIGNGDQEDKLKYISSQLLLDEQVVFVGQKTGDELNLLLNQHFIIAIPSKWEEPFGIVALEGLAAGCLPIVSQRGGLMEAIGNHGLSFPNGDHEALANCLEKVIVDAALRETLMVGVDQHLESYKPKVIAKKYLDIFRQFI